MRLSLFLLGFSVCGPIMRAQDVTEREALTRLSSESPRARALNLQFELARASARTEGLFPNGSVSFSREDAAGVPETYILYQQPLSFSGRREYLRRSAEAAAVSNDLAVRGQLHELRVDLRFAFRELLLTQEQLALYATVRGQLEEIVRILRSRERAGESSGYDRIRAERELSMFESEQREAEARLEGARGAFASFYSEPNPFPNVRAAGKLERPAIPDLNLLIERASKRGDIQAELQLAESSTLAMEAARRKRIPDPVVSGGLKSPVMDGQREGGYVLSVSIPLPLFDRGRAEVTRADVARRAALARAEAISSEIRIRIKGAWEELQSRIRAAELYEKQVGDQTEDLVRISRAAYEGGEVGILELLDAYRTDRELRLRSLDLAAGAIRAALELERLVGEEVIP